MIRQYHIRNDAFFNFSSGSVIVYFIIHFQQDIHINQDTKSRLAEALKEGFRGSLFVIDTHSLQITPVGK